MPSEQAIFLNQLFASFPGDPPGTEHDYAAERTRNAERELPKIPDGVKLEEITIGGQHAEKTTKPGNDKGWVFYIHGGGFTTGSAKERREITLYIADHYGYNVISVDYRLAPENKWPAMPEDVLAACKGLEEIGIDLSDVIFMGESAGGTLVLSLALLCRQEGLGQPKAVVTYSPCVRQSGHYPSHFDNIKTDTMLKDAVAKGMGEPVFGREATEEDLLDPIVSPIMADFTGIAPIFISVSDAEALYDDSRVLYEKLMREGHKAELDVAEGVCHAFQMFAGMLPEANETIAKTFAFIESLE